MACGYILACNGHTDVQGGKNNMVMSIGQLQELQQENKLLIDRIEQNIINAFVQAKITRNDSNLNLIEQKLQTLGSANRNAMIDYWFAYTCYYHSLYYLTLGQPKQSEKILTEGINKLEQLSSKNSEHYALLGLMTSFSIQFAPGFQAPFIARKVTAYNEKAIQSDSTNLRAWFVSGSSDYYTPEKYGGGQKAEMLLKKAIALPDQSLINPYLPSWGRSQAYELLIRLYLRQNKTEMALTIYKQAHALFPDDYMINKLAGEILN